MMDSTSKMIDEDWDYDLIIWVTADKSLQQFEQSLLEIIEPVPIVNYVFTLGRIECQIEEVISQPNAYPEIPKVEYQFKITVPCVTYLIWGLFDRRFTFSLTLGLRTKWTCQYLVTDDRGHFIMHSGTNLPVFFNANYQPWVSGELNTFREGTKAIEVRI